VLNIFNRIINKTVFMGNLLYIVAVVLIIGWFSGFFAFHAGGILHALLVIAVIAIIVRLLQGEVCRKKRLCELEDPIFLPAE
jgi:hypothetical protein